MARWKAYQVVDEDSDPNWGWWNIKELLDGGGIKMICEINLATETNEIPELVLSILNCDPYRQTERSTFEEF